MHRSVLLYLSCRRGLGTVLSGPSLEQYIMSNRKISTFKIKVISIDNKHVRFRLYSGYGMYTTHALSQSLNGEIILDVRQFVDFALRLVAFVYLDRKPTHDEISVINKSMKIIIFDNYDPMEAKPIISIKNFKNKSIKIKSNN